MPPQDKNIIDANVLPCHQQAFAMDPTSWKCLADLEIPSIMNCIDSPSSPSSPSSFPLCPKRRFGRTELDMPVLTCGGMRVQMTWTAPDGYSMDDVHPDCQTNLEETIEKSYRCGINHFETARGYGCSELQYGLALKKHMENGLFTRKDIILQTKVSPFESPEQFRKTLDKSLFETLDIHGNGIGYIDLFAFHGVNSERKLNMVLREGGCMEVLEEYRTKGLIRFVGFSTHGMEPFITKACATGKFDYVNLHYHFIGSFTASGSGSQGGNLPAIYAARDQDMGVFIISPTDKGGALFKPPKRFADLTAPLSPIEFNNLWLLSYPEIHTLVVGAARPSDFDEHMKSIARYDDAATLTKEIADRCHAVYRNVLSPRWQSVWWKGLPDCYGNIDGLDAIVDLSKNPHCVNYTVIVWLVGICKAWGFYEYARERYSVLVSNGKKLSKLISSGEGTVRDYVEGGIMNDYGPGCDPRDLPREELLGPLSATSAAGGLDPEEILEALSFAEQNLHPSKPEPKEPTLSDARPDICWPDRPKKKTKPTDYTCGGVRPSWMASAHKSLAKAMSSMEEESGKSNEDYGMAALFDGSSIPMLWFGSPAPTNASATALFQQFYRNGNISLVFKAEEVVSSSSSSVLCAEKGLFNHVHVNLLSQIQQGRYSIEWGSNQKIISFEIAYT